MGKWRAIAVSILARMRVGGSVGASWNEGNRDAHIEFKPRLSLCFL